MRCLVVEDEPDRVAAIMPELEKLFGAGNVDVADDRDSAIARVAERPFDLIVLDQRIPSGPGQMDAELIHGRSVLASIQNEVPDTPVYFLTGLPIEDEYFDHLLNEQRRCDVWGDRNPIVLIRRFYKSSLTPFYDAVRQLAETARVTDGIEVNPKEPSVVLDESEIRLLRSFARRQNGVCVDIEALSDGLSDASVRKANVRDAGGGLRISAASKIGPQALIARELDGYEREVVRLPATAYAPIVAGEMPRVGGKHGVFYRLADGFDRSLFKVIPASDGDAAECVRRIQRAEEPWFKSRAVQQVRVSDVVKYVVREDRLPGVHAQLGGIGWKPFEARELSINICTRHGDLHGENVLVDAQNQIMLIDYGSVRPLPSAMDAVTLELSPFFHPHGHRDLLRWKSGDGAIDWFDLDEFGKLSAVPLYIGSARGWARAEGFGGREVLACAYAYALRQLSLSLIDPAVSDRELAIGIVSGIVARGMT